jgi:hypothetical protein
MSKNPTYKKSPIGGTVWFQNISTSAIDETRCLVLGTAPSSKLEIREFKKPIESIPVNRGDVILKKEGTLVKAGDKLTSPIEDQDLDTMDLACNNLPAWAVVMKIDLKAWIEEKKKGKLKQGPQLEI